MIGNKILTNFDISKFEIGPLEAEEEANYNIVQIIPDFFFTVIIDDFIIKLLPELILDFGKYPK